MRAVNLIPRDQRRAAPGAATRATLASYALLGLLAAALLVVSALVVTSNQINDRKEKVAELKRKAASAEQAAKELESYGNFARLQQARLATVKGLSESRFNWERVIRALARTIPPDVWLTSFKGTVSPQVELDSEEGAGGAGGLREKAAGPAVELVGCAYSHKGVARMMVRMRNIEGVSEVALNKSERSEEDSVAQPGETGGAAGGGDCRTRSKITKFEMLVAFGNAQSATSAGAAGGQTQQAAASTGAGGTGESAPSPTGAGQ